MSSPFGKRLIVTSILALLVVPAFFFSVRVFSAWQAGYGWAEMDWDGKGHTTLLDFLKAAEIGKRPVLVNDRSCVEYFLYRDGVTVKTRCP
ncbi:hypothetical protein OGR47_18225 [Methylocystis sp. MJC1]|jgi:hypothetical protein|uniref:hypothetical protein n=1 Tax=Methylocystis sp. MJC1 TaxID=2654282 RepID=UPI0013EDEDD5|nr:hypothetical protein [Methylocystis sp. MJC1]KAF2991791.1 hypothetical protein MJC1_00813 [Methylocystis sp. MJC1]MBU6528894.1 hypothetical protein [Methylocystis sp. MJC1]UZX11778.1 hypothetical protein OGR47_18225 [Methylocystis sp. MJC1]